MRGDLTKQSQALKATSKTSTIEAMAGKEKKKDKQPNPCIFRAICFCVWWRKPGRALAVSESLSGWEVCLLG